MANPSCDMMRDESPCYVMAPCDHFRPGWGTPSLGDTAGTYDVKGLGRGQLHRVGCGVTGDTSPAVYGAGVVGCAG